MVLEPLTFEHSGYLEHTNFRKAELAGQGYGWRWQGGSCKFSVVQLYCSCVQFSKTIPEVLFPASMGNLDSAVDPGESATYTSRHTPMWAAVSGVVLH